MTHQESKLEAPRIVSRPINNGNRADVEFHIDFFNARWM